MKNNHTYLIIALLLLITALAWNIPTPNEIDKTLNTVVAQEETVTVNEGEGTLTPTDFTPEQTNRTFNKTTILPESINDYTTRFLYKQVGQGHVTYMSEEDPEYPCGDAQGCYNYINGEIVVSTELPTSYLRWATIHELAHKFYFETMTQDERPYWLNISISPCHEYVTHYSLFGGTIEDFAENFATYYTEGISYEGVNIGPESVNFLNKVFKQHQLPLMIEDKEERVCDENTTREGPITITVEVS